MSLTERIHFLLADLDSVRKELHRGVFVTAADMAWREELERQDERLTVELHALIGERLGLAA